MSESAQPHYDVVIAGGGMVGLAFALTLNQLSEGRLRVLVAEGFAVSDSAAGQPEPRPSFDARSNALSYGSRCIMEQWGIWSSLTPHLAPITDIHVSERGGLGQAELHAGERGWPALGYVIENVWLGRAMLAAVRECRSIDLWSPAEVTDFRPGQQQAQATIRRGDTQTVVSCGLLAVAAGARAGLTARLGIHTEIRDYQQHAIIANVSCSRPHHGWAYERFTDWGPMALLPLIDALESFAVHSRSLAGRMALVWTMSPALATELMAAPAQQFLTTLQQRFGYRQGRFLHCGERHCYPLRLARAVEQARRQLVLIGNAAHALHPVAGQGFNLALRDVQRLAEIICKAQRDGVAPGELSVLNRYVDSQAADQWKTILFSDRIGDLFAQPNPLLGHARRLALLLLDLDPRLKTSFINQTAGYHPGAPLGRTV
ncbi:MAG: 2-octaprenyl-6-methoxyphenyl hydroxylase [Spongiibacteraceae bacterium]|nr:2-octaprenyl-6-methoxyphenyl hydroxylase [Spongiibacteraceae bacterium]